MNIQINRVKPNHPGFTELIELLNKELWERNPGRQSEYVSLNILNPETNSVLATDRQIPIAIGAFRDMGNGIAEIKRMFVRNEYRGKGISKLILSELEAWAIGEGISKAILETGLNHPESISLYNKFSYKRIENYGAYVNMPHSICMEKKLK